MSTGKAGGFESSGTRNVAREARRLHEVERRRAMARKVFVSRVPGAGKVFRWEIRRFGTFVLATSDIEYQTAAAVLISTEI